VTEKIHEVVLLDAQQPGDGRPSSSATIAAELAARSGGKNVTTRAIGDSSPLSHLAAGQLAIASTASWYALTPTDPPSGAALLAVLDQQQPPADDDPASLLWFATPGFDRRVPTPWLMASDEHNPGQHDRGGSPAACATSVFTYAAGNETRSGRSLIRRRVRRVYGTPVGWR
jgi:hypothetical protein